MQLELEELGDRLDEAGGATQAQMELNKKREAEVCFYSLTQFELKTYFGIILDPPHPPCGIWYQPLIFVPPLHGEKRK